MNLNECIKYISHFPTLYKTEDISPNDIFHKSKYEKHRNDITIELIREIVSEDESLIELWLNYTADKRWTPAWGLILNKNGTYSVSYYSDTSKYLIAFNDKLLACSFMIKMEFEELLLSDHNAHGNIT